MFKLNFKSLFLKKVKKIVSKNKDFKKIIFKVIQILEINPFDLKLKSHKIIRKNGNPAFSSRVSGDIRIIWKFQKNQPIILDILDIGGHSGKDKVYK